MTRRLISAVLAVTGLVAIVLAVCSATVWRPSATVTATLASRPDQPYVLVEPGVLGLVDSDVTVEVQASGQVVTLAVGYSHDARAWLADDPYVSVTGLQSWSTLASQVVTERCPQESAASTSQPSATPTPTGSPAGEATATGASQEPSESQDGDDAGCTELTASGADPADGDVWQLTESGQDEASLTLDAADPDLVLLAAAGGSEPAPQLTLTWPRRVSTPWLIPGLVVGGVLVCLGVFGLLMDLQIRHADAQRRRRAAERAARLASADSVATLGIPALSDPNRPLTRRERREKERAEAAGEQWVDPRTGRPTSDGPLVPSVPEAPATVEHGQVDGAPGRATDQASDQTADETSDAAGAATEAAEGAKAAEAADDEAAEDALERPADGSAHSPAAAAVPVSADGLRDTQQIDPVRDDAEEDLPAADEGGDSDPSLETPADQDQSTEDADKEQQ